MAKVVRLDSLAAVYGGGHIHSVQSEEVIENGSVGVVGNLLEGEREVREFKKPADLTKDKAVLVAQDEINYESNRKSQNDLSKFKIPAGKPFRVYDLAEGDIFSVSLDGVKALGEKPQVGNKVVLEVGTHDLVEVEDATDERFVGRIEALEQIGTVTVAGAVDGAGNITEFVVVKVEQN